MSAKNQEDNVRNSVFTQERLEAIDKIECYVRNSKVEMTKKDINAVFKILAGMELEEYQSDTILTGMVIQLNITEKDGYEYNISILSKNIAVDGKTYYTDADYIDKIENVLK